MFGNVYRPGGMPQTGGGAASYNPNGGWRDTGFSGQLPPMQRPPMQPPALGNYGTPSNGIPGLPQTGGQLQPVASPGPGAIPIGQPPGGGQWHDPGFSLQPGQLPPMQRPQPPQLPPLNGASNGFPGMHMPNMGSFPPPSNGIPGFPGGAAPGGNGVSGYSPGGPRFASLMPGALFGR